MKKLIAILLCSLMLVAVAACAKTPEKPADVVAANILCSVLVAQVEDVISLVRPGGHLILSGILIEQYDNLKATFEAKGCAELENTTIKEWKSGLYIVRK
jgi:ribosomal protein L11 methyltransferase